MTLRGAVYGAAVGDALGVPYEFMGRDSFTCSGMASGGAHGQPKGTWSDDTALVLATCDSIREMGCVDVEDMRSRFEGWAFRGKYAIENVVFDIGCATSRALMEGAVNDGERDNGNGSLMRIIPLAFTDATDNDIRAVSAITHAHPVSMNACVDFVAYARHLAAGGEIEQDETPESDIRSGGYVLDTLKAAKWCLANTGRYAECVLKAVNLGEDTDTTACVAGALAGIVYGYDGIPGEWLDALRGKEIIESCLF